LPGTFHITSIFIELLRIIFLTDNLLGEFTKFLARLNFSRFSCVLDSTYKRYSFFLSSILSIIAALIHGFLGPLFLFFHNFCSMILEKKLRSPQRIHKVPRSLKLFQVFLCIRFHIKTVSFFLSSILAIIAALIHRFLGPLFLFFHNFYWATRIINQ